jgi:hypothetical protein
MLKAFHFIKGQCSLWRFFAFVVWGLLLLPHLSYSQTQASDIKDAILVGSIEVKPTKPLSGDRTDKIQPGTSVKLVVSVENKGQQASPLGKLYVRYAFAYPLEEEVSSIVFETEKKSLPSLEPGQKVDISFETTHQIPSLLDFVRDDWSIREYQAMAVIHPDEHLIGTLAITFSAYYYPGIKKEVPIKISRKA